MRAKLLKFLRSIVSVVVGYTVIVLCTVVGFRPLGGIIHLHAPPRTQAAGALVAIISGLLGGLITAFVAGRYPVRHAAAVLIFLCIDTGVVLSRPSPDPHWFDLAGAATLMLATVCGGVLYSYLTSRLRNPGARNPAATR
jgi:hypothetical protein